MICPFSDLDSNLSVQQCSLYSDINSLVIQPCMLLMKILKNDLHACITKSAHFTQSMQTFDHVWPVFVLVHLCMIILYIVCGFVQHDCAMHSSLSVHSNIMRLWRKGMTHLNLHFLSLHFHNGILQKRRVKDEPTLKMSGQMFHRLLCALHLQMVYIHYYWDILQVLINKQLQIYFHHAHNNILFYQLKQGLRCLECPQNQTRPLKRWKALLKQVCFELTCSQFAGMVS